MYEYKTKVIGVEQMYPRVSFVLAEQEEEGDYDVVDGLRRHDVLAHGAHGLIVEAEPLRHVQLVRPFLGARACFHQLGRQRVL